MRTYQILLRTFHSWRWMKRAPFFFSFPTLEMPCRLRFRRNKDSALSNIRSDILEWFFLIEGPPDSVYAGGWYVGRLRFPPEYPFKPPGIMMMTPNGRFKTGTRVCLSMSDFHPETW